MITTRGGKRSTEPVTFACGTVDVRVIRGRVTFADFGRTVRAAGVFAKLPGWGWYRCEREGGGLVAYDAVAL